MTLNEATVHKIAHLARLTITDQDSVAFTDSLNKVFTLLSQMNSVNTDNIPPMAHPMEGGLRLRIDEVTETDQREVFLSIAPQAEAGLFLVPQVIE